MINCLICALYIQGGISIHDQIGHITETGKSYYLYNVTEVKNPYGYVRIGLPLVETKKLTFAVEVRHESAIPIRDHGINSIDMNITWRPFR